MGEVDLTIRSATVTNIEAAEKADLTIDYKKKGENVKLWLPTKKHHQLQILEFRFQA